MNDPSNTILPEWHNENAMRTYPLADDCPAGGILPTWLLSDLRVSVDASFDRVFVSSAYLSGTLVSVGISGTAGSDVPVGLLTKTVTRDELEPGRAYAFESMDGQAAGTVVFGEFPDDPAPFKFGFRPHESPLAANAFVRVKPPGVTRLVDPVHGTSVAGIVDLSGNNEFRTYLDPDDPSGRTIIIALSDLYRDISTSVCSASPSFDNCGKTPVKTINGVPPDGEGRLYLKFR